MSCMNGPAQYAGGSATAATTGYAEAGFLLALCIVVLLQKVSATAFSACATWKYQF